MRRLSLLGFLLLWVQVAMSHDLDLTMVKVDRVGTQTTIEVKTPLSRFVRTAHLGANPSGPELDVAVRERLQLGDPVPSNLQVDSRADLLVWSASLPDQDFQYRRRFDDSTPAARTVVANLENGRPVSESVLDAESTHPASSGFFLSGFHHILSGWDHVLFVMGLVLLGGGFRVIVKALSAFTITHTVTMYLAAAGILRVPSAVAEPLIALSLVALAWEGLRPRKSAASSTVTAHIGMAAGFGLVHGMGFAGGLTEFTSAGSSLLQRFVPFMLGIEVGQLAVLAPALFAFSLATKVGKEKSPAWLAAASIGLGMAGCFWFVERLL